MPKPAPGASLLQHLGRDLRVLNEKMLRLSGNHRADQLHKQHRLAGMAAALGQGLDKADGGAVEAQGAGVIERGDDVAELGRQIAHVLAALGA